MKNLLILLICIFAYSCNSSKKSMDISSDESNKSAQDTVRIANDELEYEIIIIDPGFNTWIETTAKPRGYYEQSYFESRNQVLVSEWNSRVNQPQRFDPNLYEMQVDYQHNIDYGYEVNYMLYNYFVYFQLEYNQRLSGFLPKN